MRMITTPIRGQHVGRDTLANRQRVAADGFDCIKQAWQLFRVNCVVPDNRPRRAAEKSP